MNVLKEGATCIIPLTHIDIRGIDNRANGSAVAPENQPHLMKYITIHDLSDVQLKLIHRVTYIFAIFITKLMLDHKIVMNQLIIDYTKIRFYHVLILNALTSHEGGGSLGSSY